jgi:poly-gamma-glutamate synthesis protein (capsule biosynthesis protein)
MAACSAIPNGGEPAAATETAVPAATATPLPEPTATTDPLEALEVWIDPGLPQALQNQIQLPDSIKLAESEAQATLKLTMSPDAADAVNWTYVLVAPFSSLLEDATFEQVQAAWQGQNGLSAPLMVAEEDITALESLLGPLSRQSVKVVSAANLLEEAWNSRDVFALVPFEDLAPKWKVISLNGQSPVSNQFVEEDYPLLVKNWLGWRCRNAQSGTIAERGG